MQGALIPAAITWRNVDASAPAQVVLGDVLAWVRACASRAPRRLCGGPA